MKNKITQSIPIVVAILFVGYRYFSNWCIDYVSSCYGSVISHTALTVAKPLYFFALYSIPLTIILIFIPRRLFNSWFKLAVWAVPLALIFIALTPVNSNAWMDLYPFYRDDAARLAAEIFSAASLLLILYRWFSYRRINIKV